jgi:hypothetical protein
MGGARLASHGPKDPVADTHIGVYDTAADTHRVLDHAGGRLADAPLAALTWGKITIQLSAK